MGRIELEHREVDNLYYDLRGAPARIQWEVRGHMPEYARMVEVEMKRDARGHRHLSHLPAAVTWEMIDAFEAEIGLGPPGQGSLAHIIVYGSVNNGPVYDAQAGPRRALPRIAEKVADLAEKSVLGGEK